MVIGEIAGIQNLYARVVVPVERCYCARTTSFGRVGGIGKPDSEVIRLNWNRPWIEDKSLIIKNTGHVQDTSSHSVGC